MRRETAYRLAGRHHDHPVAAAGLHKEREIRFAAFPPGQVDRAIVSLGILRGLRIERTERPQVLAVSYSIVDYSLEVLEDGLVAAGFHLENTLYARLIRAIVYFCEETERHNLESPERLIKKSNEVYITVYDQHPHGDHDDTPPEIRDYK